jgi:hypothetical protein
LQAKSTAEGVWNGPFPPFAELSALGGRLPLHRCSKAWRRSAQANSQLLD